MRLDGRDMHQYLSRQTPADRLCQLQQADYHTRHIESSLASRWEPPIRSFRTYLKSDGTAYQFASDIDAPTTIVTLAVREINIGSIATMNQVQSES